MKNISVLLTSFLLVICCISCKKEILLRTYTVSLDMQPDKASSAGVVDSSKHIFLSLSMGEVYNAEEAKANSSKIDLVLYDGSTTTTSIGDIHWVSPGGGTLSMNTAPGVYLYREVGNPTASVQFYQLTDMDEWTSYNTTKIRDLSGMNGFTEANFNALEHESDYNSAIAQIQEPGNDNSNVAKKVLTISNNTLVSKIWYFEYQSASVTKTALAKITDYRHLPDGFLTLEVKMLN